MTALSATAVLWKWLGQTWVSHHLDKSLEGYKAEQQKEFGAPTKHIVEPLY